ncbi:MAG: hypothetical protein P8Z37_12395 [Acidobacteriota bacterium]
MKNWMRLCVLDTQRRIVVRHVRRMFSKAGILSFAVIGLSSATFPHVSLFAQNTPVRAATGLDQTNSSTGSVRNYAGVAFRSSNRPDPFLNPLLKKKESNKDQEISRGLPPPGIAGTFIAEAELKGISIQEDGRRLAIVNGNGNRAYFLREGDKLFDGYLKTIHRDSITLVRVTEMRSGKVITQEVTKKLRTP